MNSYEEIYTLRVLLVGCILFEHSKSFGQIIFTNPITGTNPNTFNPYTVGQNFDGNITVSGIGRGTGINGAIANDRYNATSWNTATFDPNDYFEFTLVPNSGATINFANFSYTGQASGTGPVNFVFRSSLDGFTSDIGSANALGTTINLSASTYQGITSLITFRFYGWGGTGGTYSINDFTFTGVVTPVTPKYYRSITSGDWSLTTTWESADITLIWLPATLTPSASDLGITIQNSHVVTVSKIISLDETTIAGTLRLLSTYPYSSVINIGPSPDAINVSTGGKIAIGDGSIAVGAGYEGFATSLANVWNDASIFEWNSSTNFVFNGNTYFPNAGSAVPKFTVTNVAGPIGGGTDAFLNGLLIVNSNFSFGSGGNKTIRDGIAGKATLTIPSTIGTVYINGPAPILGGSNLTIATDKDINITNGITVPLDSIVKVMPATVGGTPQFTSKGNNNFIVNGTIDMTTVTVTNTTGAVIINGTLKTAHPGGLEATATSGGGTVSTQTSTTQVNTGSTIEYNATAGNQVITGSGVLEGASPYYNIIFSGGSTKTPGNAVNVNTTGSVKITGTTTVNATNNNIGLTIPNTTAFTMDDGKLILGTAQTLPLMDGTYNVTGGLIQYATTGQTIRGGKTYYAIEITNGSNVLAGAGDITLGTNGSFTVKSGGIFTITNNKTINGFPVNGTQSVTVENGGLFRCGSNQGFNGYPEGFAAWSSIDATITHINLNAGSTVEYMYAGNQQITNANALIYSNLLITGSGIKTAPPLMPSAPSPILTVRGNLTKSGTSTFIHNGGTVLLDSTGAQTFAGLTYNNLILTNNVKTTNGNSTIIDSIKINDGTTLSVSAFDTITLRSDPATTKTARVGQIGTGNINYGTDSKFVVERYIPAKRAWRFLSVATNSLQTIKQAWQENSMDINDNPKPGYGTQITDNNIATFAANGFDAYSQNGPSMKTYNPSTDTYTGIPNTNVIAFDPTLGGYMTFIRGDRTASAFGSPVTSTVLRTAGQLYTGNQPDISLTTGRAVPVNNYYASPIDLRNISTSPNIFFYVWDPNYATGYGLGGFQTLSWNVTDNDYDVFPGNTGSYGTKNNFIESGQAFFASTFGPGLSLPVTENAKGISVPSIEPFIPQGIPGQKLKTFLYTVNSDSTTTLADAVMNSFADDYSNAVDGMDAKKLFNFGENISIKTSGELLVIERKHTVVEQDTVFLDLSGLSVQQYRLRFDAANMNTGNLEAFAEDTYLHTRTSINLDGVTDINFTVTEAAGSYASNRFRIIFSPAAGALPVTFTSVKAFQKSENIVVEWKVENEINIKRYEVEKSLNGTQFTILSIIAAGATNSSYTVDYSSTDTRPAAGYNYYRIKSVDVNGTIKYSDVVKVLIGNTKRSIMIYPNPVKNNMLRIQFNNQPSGPYLLKLINNVGQVSISKQIDHVEGSHIETIPLEKLAHGIYRLEIIFPRGNKKSLNFIY